MSPSPQRQRPLRNRLFIPAVATLVLVALFTLVVAVNAAVRANVGALGILALFLVFAVALITALATTEIIPWRELTWLHLRQPRILGAFGSVMLVSFGAVFTYIPLLGAEGGLEGAAKEIRERLGQISDDTRAARQATEATRAEVEELGNRLDTVLPEGEVPMVEQRINGVWGRPQKECSTTYRFTLSEQTPNGRTLVVDSLVSPPKLDPYHAQFSYKVAGDQIGQPPGEARSILTVEELSGMHEGASVDFTLVRSGTHEKLIWDSKSTQQNSVELYRCPES